MKKNILLILFVLPLSISCTNEAIDKLQPLLDNINTQIKSSPTPKISSKVAHINGVITDENNNKISDVQIKIDNREIKTDSSGYYSINDLAVGKTRIIAFKDGYEESNITVDLKSDVQTINIKLKNSIIIVNPTNNIQNTPTQSIIPTNSITQIPIPTNTPTPIPTQSINNNQNNNSEQNIIPSVLKTPIPTPIPTGTVKTYDPIIENVMYAQPRFKIPNQLKPNQAEISFYLKDSEKSFASSIYWDYGKVIFNYKIYENISKYQASQPKKGALVLEDSMIMEKYTDSKLLEFINLKYYGSYFIIEYEVNLPDGRVLTNAYNTLIW